MERRAPVGYHATNVALHAVASVLVLALLRRLRSDGVSPSREALVFAVHPALAPAVAWIPGRNDTLWRCSGSRRGSACEEGSTAAHLVFFALALMAKETAVALPVVWAAEMLSAGRSRTQTVAGGSVGRRSSWRGSRSTRRRCTRQRRT